MNIAWFILFLVVFIFIQSYIYTKWGLKKLTYHREFNKHSVFVGQEIMLIDEIVNQKLLPIPWVRLESKLDQSIQVIGRAQFDESDREVYRTVLSLLPYQRLIRRHHFTVTKRGVFDLDKINLTLGDMFGFAEKHNSLDTDAEVIVYPDLIDYGELSLPAKNFLGEQSVKRWIIEDPFLSVGSRDYEAGDSINKINWKASARTKSVQVKVNDFTADRELMILVNGDQSDDIWIPIRDDALFEHSISLAATIAHYLEENGESYSLLTNIMDRRKKGVNETSFVTIEASNGSTHYNHLLNMLAHLISERSRHFKYLLDEIIQEKRERCDIYLITPVLTADIFERVDQLRSAGHTVEIDHLISNEQGDIR